MPPKARKGINLSADVSDPLYITYLDGIIVWEELKYLAVI